jgi:hypothetical protein
MKKLTFTIILISMISFGSSFGQSLEKGNLLGIHNLTVNLDPDVTMNQYKEFVLTKMIPAWEEHFEMKVYLLHAIRGEHANSLGFAFIYESDEIRNKYWNDDGSPSELWNTQAEKVQAINDEGSKLGTWTSSYNDWVVQ